MNRCQSHLPCMRHRLVCVTSHLDNLTVMEWSGIGVAGTQHLTQANERPQQAVYSSNEIFFADQNQHEYNRHKQPSIHSERRAQRNQAKQ